MNTPTPNLSVASESAKSFLDQGVSASQAGQGEQACAFYRQAIDVAPGWALPHFLLASEYASMSDFTQAEALFAQAVVLAPDFDLARYQLGLLQHTGGRPQVALVTWAPLLEGAENQPFAHLVRGFMAHAAGLAGQAVAHFQHARQLAAGNPALVSDIDLLIREAEGGADASVDRPSTAVAPAAAANASTELPAAEGDHHVLLGNYARTLH